jgi:phage-related protein
MVAHMSNLTYAEFMNPTDKPFVWLHGEVKTPPFSPAARLGAGFLLRKLQRGETLLLPHSRPMHSIGPHCHELSINDLTGTWRIIYRIDADAILIVEVFEKKTPQTPRRVIELCQQRLRRYDILSK